MNLSWNLKVNIISPNSFVNFLFDKNSNTVLYLRVGLVIAFSVTYYKYIFGIQFVTSKTLV